MPYLGNIPASAFSGLSYQDLTGGTGTSFTLDHSVSSAQDIEVFVNNVRQEPGVAYTVAGVALTMTGSIVATDDFYVVFQAKTFSTVSHPAGNPLQATSGTFSGAISVASASVTGDLTVDTSTLYVDSTNNRVGINNASPTTALEVDSDGATTAIFDRATDDGNVLEIRSSGTTMGSIGTDGTSTYIVFRTEANGDGCGLRGSGALTGAIVPVDGDGSAADDHINLGATSIRFDNIYATNGTISTSDQNEKQQIAALTDAEMTAAKAISALFKTFKWNSAVEIKGDAARTHTGVIAQDVEAAMTAAGLDAGDYAFFISETWTDDNGNSQTRKGIRYAELLAFVGAATEQRLTDIETRLTALEN